MYFEWWLSHDKSWIIICEIGRSIDLVSQHLPNLVFTYRDWKHLSLESYLWILPFSSSCQRVSLLKLYSDLAQWGSYIWESVPERGCFYLCKSQGGPLGTIGQGCSELWVPRLQIWACLCVPGLCYILGYKPTQESAGRPFSDLCTHTQGFDLPFIESILPRRQCQGLPRIVVYPAYSVIWLKMLWLNRTTKWCWQTQIWCQY